MRPWEYGALIGASVALWAGWASYRWRHQVLAELQRIRALLEERRNGHG